jgi:hypothetical protein
LSATAQGAAEAPTALRSQACSSADPSPASDLRWDWCSTARPAHFIISATGLDLISATADANHSWRKAKKNTQRGRERQRQRQMQGQDRDRDVGRNTDTHTDTGTDTHTHTHTHTQRQRTHVRVCVPRQRSHQMWALLWITQIVVKPADSRISPLCQGSHNGALAGLGWLRGGGAEALQ